MASSMNLSLTDELRDFVNSRTGNRRIYATPSEYLRDLIRGTRLRSCTRAGAASTTRARSVSDKSIN